MDEENDIVHSRLKLTDGEMVGKIRQARNAGFFQIGEFIFPWSRFVMARVYDESQ
jgi:hypothetical protein